MSTLTLDAITYYVDQIDVTDTSATIVVASVDTATGAVLTSDYVIGRIDATSYVNPLGTRVVFWRGTYMDGSRARSDHDMATAVRYLVVKHHNERLCDGGYI